MKKRIDWKAIEKDFHAGKVSIRAIASGQNVTEGAIRRRAKAGGWWRQPIESGPNAFALAGSLQRLLDAAPADIAARLRAEIDQLIGRYAAEIARPDDQRSETEV